MAGEVSDGKLVRVAMVDAHGAVARSGVVAAVTVKPASALASRPYNKDQIREREVRDATVVAGHGQACSRWCTATMAAMASSQCSLTLLDWLC